MICNA